MKNLKTIGLLFLFAILLFSSCRKDEELQGSFPPDLPPTPDVIVNGSFSGIVTDETNQGIDNVLITFGNNSITTDQNGYFSFENVEINSKGSLVTAKKDGYFYNSKFVSSKLNKQNFTKIKMIPKTLTDSFMSNSGGSITTSDGASVEFPADAIKLENGGIYNGNVKVYATWLDPSSADISLRMPGDLRAMNTDNEQQQLTTFGMIAVELESDAGEALNIADGQTATIEIPVPDALMASAPSTIPLWHFDESTGYWVEEGQATLQGNRYVGIVSHFSFWNYDIPNDYINISGTITDTNGDPVPNTLVTITEVSSGMSGFGWTDEDGVYAGAVPSDQELTIEIFDNCGELIYSEDIGSFSADASIPIIAINTEENFYTVFGTLVDCDNNPLANGYLKLDFGFGPLIVLADENGAFSETVNICNATTVEVNGFDLENIKTSTTLTEDLNGMDSLDLANVFVCEDLSEYIIYNIGGFEYIDTEPFALIAYNEGIPGAPDEVVMQASSPSLPNLTFRVFVDGTGTYSPSLMMVSSTLQTNSLRCDNMECDVNIEITTLEIIGGFIIGSFSGIVDPTLSSGTPEEVSGTFKAILI